MQLDASTGACRTRVVTIAVSDKSSAVARTTLCATSALRSHDLSVGMLSVQSLSRRIAQRLHRTAIRVSADTEPLRPLL